MAEPRYRFNFPLKVRYADTDAQGHVFFGNYFTFMDEAAGGYLRGIGFSWNKLSELGLDIFYVDASCQFKGSASFDDMLEIDARMERIGNASFTIECAIYQQDSGKLIAKGQITAVVVNPATRQPQRVPDELRQAVASYEGPVDP
jgi:acyl-CoA thioester hydrolase